MTLKTGTIVWFKYSKYKHDKNPLALILFDADKYGNVHAINLNYLPEKLTTQVINFIVKIISRELKANDMRELYHSYISNKMSPVVSAAYRTYKKDEIKNARIVSKGFSGAVELINKKFKPTPAQVKTEKKTIIKQIDSGKKIMKSLEKLTPDEALKKAQEYIKIIQGYKPDSKDEISLKDFTIAKRKKEIIRKR